MTQEHPIALPPELVDQWFDGDEYELATQAARWGADQELEACCEWLVANDWKAVHKHLREARRPRQPSLKEQALQALYRFDDTEGHEGLTQEQIAEDYVIIRHALESLPD